MVLCPFIDFKQQNLELQDGQADNDQGSTSIGCFNLIAIQDVFLMCMLRKESIL